MKSGYLFFGLFLLLISRGFAQNADQSSSGVLVSPPINEQVAVQEISDNAGNSEVSPQKTDEKSSESSKVPSPPADDIVAKSTDAMMSQITANMKLTQDQTGVVRGIIEDYTAKTRSLQLSMQNGTLDAKAMYAQRQQLTKDEAVALSRIFTSDQMKVWINIQADQ